MVFILFKFAIQDFLDDRKFKNLSPETLKGYEITLKEFHNYCTDNNLIDTSDITPRVIKNYLIHCQNERSNNPVTLNHKIRNLKIFFNYLEEIEIYDEKNNPAKPIPYLKEDVKIEVFTDYQIRQMLTYYRRLKTRDKAFWAYRDYTIIVTLLGTGIRLGELVNLQWRHIDFVNQVMTIFGKKRIQRSIPLTEKLVKELAEFKVFCERYFGKLNDYVFVNSKNEPMTADAVKCMFKRLKEIMNFRDVRLSAHTFRHTFAHRFLMNGGDVFSLQKILGHSKIEMTMRYVALWGTALKEQNEKYNPLSKLDFV
ncbi:integrase family protein [Thermosediminibacter oceani DSM 16646]|uniref:Integrase family protein n=1 Tax=Thermosediminibacter oceani (strain ATCC BAA-1034 / DSM 16646 / JW/IW-1228P) TaxID=555079 RepID=D9S2W7_THEOJ|nr:tyrosine-type recombinase/integrase [Thermosediminibacter oceani]ADL07744.1 integrase family protein [Thermosediminibacter oceani DSM 16646]